MKTTPTTEFATRWANEMERLMVNKSLAEVAQVALEAVWEDTTMDNYAEAVIVLQLMWVHGEELRR